MSRGLSFVHGHRRRGYRLADRTPAFHPENRGSIPRSPNLSQNMNGIEYGAIGITLCFKLIVFSLKSFEVNNMYENLKNFLANGPNQRVPLRRPQSSLPKGSLISAWAEKCSSFIPARSKKQNHFFETLCRRRVLLRPWHLVAMAK